MKYGVRQANAEDREGILRIWRENLPAATPERYDAIYNRAAGGRGTLWVASDDSGALVGCAGLCPRDVYIAGRRASSGVAVDFAIRPEHRGFGPALKLQRAVLGSVTAGGMEFVYGFPNPAASAVFRLAGYRKFAAMERRVKLFHARDKLEEKLGHGRVVDAASKLADITLRSSPGELFTHRPEVQSLDLKAFDSRFEVVWRRARSGNIVIGQRDPPFLQWRHERLLGESETLVAFRIRGNTELLGYVTYTTAGRIATVTDVLGVDPRHMTDLLHKFVSVMRHSGMDSISVSYVGAKLLAAQLKTLGFRRREAKREVYVFGGDDEHALCDAGAWHLMSADDL